MLNSKDAIVKNTSKRFSFARNAIKIALLFVSLGILAPTPVQAESAATNSQSIALTGAKVFTEVKKGKESEYTQEEIDRGIKRVLNLAAYYNSIYKEDGKTKKSKKELEESKYIVDLFGNLSMATYGKFADKLEVLKIRISDYCLVFANGQLFDCSIENIDYREELEKGYINALKALESLQSDTTKDGKIKTQEQLDLDKIAFDRFKEYIVSDADMEFVYTEFKNKAEGKTSIDLPENQKRLEKILRNINFLTKVAIYECEINNSIEGGKKISALNETICLYFELNGEDITKSKKNPMKPLDSEKMYQVL